MFVDASLKISMTRPYSVTSFAALAPSSECGFLSTLLTDVLQGSMDTGSCCGSFASHCPAPQFSERANTACSAGGGSGYGGAAVLFLHLGMQE